jgi:hypothetical protein
LRQITGSADSRRRRRQLLRRPLRLLLDLLLLRLRLRLRLRSRRRLRRALGGNDLAAAAAIGQPQIVDRMLDRVQAGTGGEHPAGEDALHLALQGHLVDLDEGVGVRRLFRRARVAGPGGELQRAELHGLADVHGEVDDAAGDLVETGEMRGRMHDALRRRSHDLVIGRWRSGRRSRGSRRARRRAAARQVRIRQRTRLHTASGWRRIVLLLRRIVLRGLLRRRWILARRLRCPAPPARADIATRTSPGGRGGGSPKMKPNCASAVLAPKVTTPATRTALRVDWASIDWAMDIPRRNLRQAVRPR